MNKKLTIEESLNKIKFMMNYDSSKTRIENKISFVITEQDTDQSTTCPNSITYEDMTKQVAQIANNVKKMNTAFLRMGKGQERAKNLYQWIKYLNSKNMFDQELGECTPALQKANEIWSSQFRDYFSQGESMVEELQQLTAGYFKSDPLSLRYLNAAIKLLENPTTPSKENAATDENKIDDENKPATVGGYKEVTGTADDPYRINTSGEGIGTMQTALGLTPDKKFGAKTQAALSPLGIQTFTNEDIPNLMAKIQGKSSPQVEPAVGQRDVAYTQPQKAATSQLAPKVAVNPKPYVAQVKPKVQNVLNPDPNANKLRPGQNA